MSNSVYIKFQILILQSWRLTFLSHRVGHCRSCLRVPVGLLVVGSIAGQWGPSQRRVLDPFCNSKRHIFSRWGRDRCIAALLVEATGAKGSGTTWPTVLCVWEKGHLAFYEATGTCEGIGLKILFENDTFPSMGSA